MDFFEAQARAQRRTGRLVVLFGFAVAGTVAATYFATLLILHNTGGDGEGFALWDPMLFLMTMAGVLLVVGGASLFKWSQLSQGGSAIAEMVGGTRIQPGTASANEKRLLNIVEEMSIASSIPVPAVYILEDESAINAFAAGLNTGDAVVAVTRGTLEKLNRDELQGVVAHEFSHILHGDMRLNVRLTSLLFGILVLGLMGRGILRGLRGVRVSSGKGKKGGGVAVIVLIGLALLIIGYVGYFFGRLIQSAVSRQREFLADASAVQFTRNPAGIGGALKKIGGYSLSSYVDSEKAGQIGHFFFAEGVRSWLGGILATHPPLSERIRAVEPSWDGSFVEPPQVVDVSTQSFVSAGLTPPLPPPIPKARPAIRHAAELLEQAGSLTQEHCQQASQLLDTLPPGLREAAQGPEGAQQIVLALLSASPNSVDPVQNSILSLPKALRLPLAQLSCGGLRHLTSEQGKAFIARTREAVQADGVVTPFELALQAMVIRVLEQAREPNRVINFYSFQAVHKDLQVILSALAWTGASKKTSAAQSFSVGAGELPFIQSPLELLAEEACTLAALSEALERLGSASLPIRKRLLNAAAQVIGADGKVTDEEMELLRAISAAVDCPVPAN